MLKHKRSGNNGTFSTSPIEVENYDASPNIILIASDDAEDYDDEEDVAAPHHNLYYIIIEISPFFESQSWATCLPGKSSTVALNCLTETMWALRCRPGKSLGTYHLRAFPVELSRAACRPGNVSPTTSRPGIDEFVAGDSGHDGSDNYGFPLALSSYVFLSLFMNLMTGRDDWIVECLRITFDFSTLNMVL
nr:hypothetical protein [Tanacetum cinerariifolium]